MPVSEAHLDAPRDLVRLRYPSFTGELRGVMFVDGAAQNGCAPHIAERLRGIFGAVVEVVGPWEPAPVAAEVPTAPEAAPPTIPQPIEPFARASRAHRGR